MDNAAIQVYEVKRRLDLVEWLEGLLPELDLPPRASEEELRAALADGSVLCGVLSRLGCQYGDCCETGGREERIHRFLSCVDEMGMPSFHMSDLEQGSLSAVVECLLYLGDYFNTDNREYDDRDLNSALSDESASVKSQGLPEVGGLRNDNGIEPSTASPQHVGDNFHNEAIQMKPRHFSALSAAKISEMITSDNLNNTSTQSLVHIITGVIDESIEKKNGEVPHRIGHLLKKVAQEIELRISIQAAHIQYLNNLIKTREEKHQFRFKVQKVLATGTNEEMQIAKDLLQHIKSEKLSIEDKQQNKEQDMLMLMKEKENCDSEIAKLKKEVMMQIESHNQKYLELETKSRTAKIQSQARLEDVKLCLAESTKRVKELEGLSELKIQNWKEKENLLQKFVEFQSQSLGDLRVVSSSIKKEMKKAYKVWEEESALLGMNLKGLTDAAENYHSVLAENRRLYNEIQELKGNIRVYCRVRPFLPGQNGKSTTINFIGEDGELLIVNPSKGGKDSHRMFKFNKVFGPNVSQEEVFLDIQPLIRSVLDGYNVCIFAYGQTGSGKTYTMSGPNSLSQEDWGVNYRALNDLFHISRTRRNTFIYEVGVQMVEIYNEQVRDLLSNDSSQKRLGIWNTSQPNGLAVPDATMHPVKSTADVVELMQVGQINRAIGATALNERSSRSHSVVTVHVRGLDLESGATLRGCLHLVDLAGSERVDRSEATGERLKEAQHINKSLSALGDVISALAQKNLHVPYRNSKLTQVLQSSLGGQAKTLMFVQINPDVESYSETISTLKFAERVSGVELGSARSSKEGKDVKDLMEQVASLKGTVTRKDEEIERLRTLKDFKHPSTNVSSKSLANNLSRQLSSSSGKALLYPKPQKDRKVLSRKSLGLTNKAVSDSEACSECSDKHSEAGSLQSVDYAKLRKESFSQNNYVGEEKADIDLLGFGDGDSEERLSDISDSGLSMGTETDGSINSVIEYILFPEVGKPTQEHQEKLSKNSSQIPQHSLKKVAQQALVRSKSKSTASGSRKSVIQQLTSSSGKPPKRWQ